MLFITQERMERNQYSNEELAEMIAVYRECRKNQRQAAALYAQRFPDKQHPDHSFFYFFYVFSKD